MFEQYDDILTVSELAEALKVGSTQAYRLVRSQKIKAFKERQKTGRFLRLLLFNTSQIKQLCTNCKIAMKPGMSHIRNMPFN